MHPISSILASYADGQNFLGSHTFWHWCPACQMMHPLPHTWERTGTAEEPTYKPSFMQNPDTPGKRCHYIITAGMIIWSGDSWHGRTGTEPMTRLDAPGVELSRT